MAFTGTLGKKTKKHGWPRRTPGFQSKHPLNFISHYISNLITWWNVTPAGVLGCWGRAWWEDPVSSQRGRSASLLPLEGSVDLGAPPRPAPASLRRKPRPPFINGSSWAAAMSCQAALRLRALYSAHMQGPAVAARANITSPSGQKIRPTHSKNRPLHSLRQPEGVKLERLWYEPWERCLPSTPAALPLKLIMCNFTYIMGYHAFRMTAIVNHFCRLWQVIKLCFAKQNSI